jgi:hypothetical protein
LTEEITERNLWEHLTEYENYCYPLAIYDDEQPETGIVLVSRILLLLETGRIYEREIERAANGDTRRVLQHALRDIKFILRDRVLHDESRTAARTFLNFYSQWLLDRTERWLEGEGGGDSPGGGIVPPMWSGDNVPVDFIRPGGIRSHEVPDYLSEIADSAWYDGQNFHIGKLEISKTMVMGLLDATAETMPLEGYSDPWDALTAAARKVLETSEEEASALIQSGIKSEHLSALAIVAEELRQTEGLPGHGRGLATLKNHAEATDIKAVQGENIDQLDWGRFFDSINDTDFSGVAGALKPYLFEEYLGPRAHLPLTLEVRGEAGEKPVTYFTYDDQTGTIVFRPRPSAEPAAPIRVLPEDIESLNIMELDPARFPAELPPKP